MFLAAKARASAARRGRHPWSVPDCGRLRRDRQRPRLEHRRRVWLVSTRAMPIAWCISEPSCVSSHQRVQVGLQPRLRTEAHRTGRHRPRSGRLPLQRSRWYPIQRASHHRLLGAPPVAGAFVERPRHGTMASLQPPGATIKPMPCAASRLGVDGERRKIDPAVRRLVSAQVLSQRRGPARPARVRRRAGERLDVAAHAARSRWGGAVGIGRPLPRSLRTTFSCPGRSTRVDISDSPSWLRSLAGTTGRHVAPAEQADIGPPMRRTGAVERELRLPRCIIPCGDQSSVCSLLMPDDVAKSTRHPRPGSRVLGAIRLPGAVSRRTSPADGTWPKSTIVPPRRSGSRHRPPRAPTSARRRQTSTTVSCVRPRHRRPMQHSSRPGAAPPRARTASIRWPTTGRRGPRSGRRCTRRRQVPHDRRRMLVGVLRVFVPPDRRAYGYHCTLRPR